MKICRNKSNYTQRRKLFFQKICVILSHLLNLFVHNSLYIYLILGKVKQHIQLEITQEMGS